MATPRLSLSDGGHWPRSAILAVFWIYVALSNLLYARGMSASIDPAGTGHFFARWDARLVQLLLLFPVLLLCAHGSLRLGWRGGLRIALQVQMGLGFAALAQPLLYIGEYLMKELDTPASGASTLFGGVQDQSMWLASAINFLLTYGFALALVTGFSIYRRYRDTQLRIAAIERAWSGARLAALRMQLSPHTLFNLLHTIRGQIAWEPALAQSMIVQLGELLRRLLTAGERDFTRLSDELQFARLYLQLQQQRFSDRLSVTLPDPAALPSLWVPSLILQPLIENAVVHGLAAHDGPVSIRVDAQLADGALILQVINTIAASCASDHDGIGLRNVRERLAVHFGEGALFSAGPAASEWVARLHLPPLHDQPALERAA